MPREEELHVVVAAAGEKTQGRLSVEQRPSAAAAQSAEFDSYMPYSVLLAMLTVAQGGCGDRDQDRGGDDR
ncbi:hypothetical protein ACWCP6_28710 [Streptomyces sp. NPDC002004]